MQKIDIVIAWVDGADPILSQKRQQYLTGEAPKDAVSETRFASNHELYYAIASILKYVPFAGTIYIVTDHQKPQFIDEFAQQGLCAEDKIQVIDHQILFSGYGTYLPTFNSLSIETMLWNVPNLSENFIYMNDDFFFNSDSELTDFITEDDSIKIYGHWQSNFVVKTKYLWRKWRAGSKKREPKYTVAQMLSADMIDLNRYYEIHHRPHILKRSILAEYFNQHAEQLVEQIKHRFRDADQFLPVGLCNHLCIKAGKAELLRDLDIAYLKNSKVLDEFLNDVDNAKSKFGCIQSLDQFEPQLAQKVSTMMQNKFKKFLPHSLIVN